MEESEQDRSGTVGETTEQHPTTSIHGLGQFDVALDGDAHPGAEATDIDDAGTVLISDRQKKKQILHAVNIEPGQLRREGGTDTLQFGNRFGRDGGIAAQMRFLGQS